MKSYRRRPLRRRALHAIVAAASAVTLGLVLVPPPTAAASVPAAPLHLTTISPGHHPALRVDNPVNIVFVGYDRSAIDVRHMLAGLPATGDPSLRALTYFTGAHVDVGLRYQYRYLVQFAPRAFDDAFFTYLASSGGLYRSGPVIDYYNHQQHRSLTVGPAERLIDAASTEAWLEHYARSALGIAAGENTVFLINWYGRPDFQFHAYRHDGQVDPDTGIDPATSYLTLTRAWGGVSGPTWFLDLSAGPVWDDNSYDVDTADFNGDGIVDYRLPPIWDYGNTTAYRPFTDLSGDLGLAIRYVAVDMLFTPSPFYDPGASVPGPGGAKQIALDIFEGDPATNGLNDVHPAVIRAMHQALEPYYPVGISVRDLPMTADVLNAYNIAGNFVSAPGCWNEFGDTLSEFYCFFRDHHSEYFPPPGNNTVIPVVGFTVPGNPVPNFSFAGLTDSDWHTGRPNMIEILDCAANRQGFYASAYTNIGTHEVGHFVGLSHPFQGYDSTSGTEFGPTGPFNIAWMGDQSATVMSYLPGPQSFDVFDRDNVARWQVARLLDFADSDSAAIIAHPFNARADALLVRADAEFSAAVIAMRVANWVTAATLAVAAYADVQRADSLAGVTPASVPAAAAQALAATTARSAGNPIVDPVPGVNSVRTHGPAQGLRTTITALPAASRPVS